LNYGCGIGDRLHRLYAISTDRAYYVFELLLTNVFKVDVELTLGVFLHAGRYADAPWLGKAFQACRHIDAITEDVSTIKDDVAMVYAHPKFDPFLAGHLGIPLNHPTLELDSAAQRVHHARELYEPWFQNPGAARTPCVRSS
jgi:hypothetical protein